MMAVIIALTVTKKLPLMVIYSMVPVLTAMLALGYSFAETAKMIEQQVYAAMTNTALLLLFSMTFFSVLSEAGMFTRIVNRILKITHGNPYLIMLCTVLVTIISDLDGSLVTTYVITIPTMLPLYDSIRLDRKYLLLLTGLTTAVMTNYPWDIGIATMATIADVDPMQMSLLALPLSGVALLIVICLIVIFGRRHQKLAPAVQGENPEVAVTCGSDRQRPKLFYVNLALFIGLIVALISLRTNAYLIFMLFTCAAFIVNYRDEATYRAISKMTSATFINPVLMIISISVMVGVLKNAGILDGFAEILLSVMPPAIARYAHILFALLIVPMFRFIPYQVYQALYPFIVAIGVSAGVPAIYTLLPFTVPLIFGCCCSPMVAQTYLGAELSKVDIDEFVRFAFPICALGNVALILISMALGILR